MISGKWVKRGGVVKGTRLSQKTGRSADGAGKKYLRAGVGKGVWSGGRTDGNN